MITVRRSEERGHFDHGWLSTYHTFSFGNYFDPRHQGFGSLRVINEDWVQPGRGFGAHPHRDMEIITYVLEGALEHRDSMGNHGIIQPGEVQRMSAGTGVSHSEFNHSQSRPVHLLQIWIFPARNSLPPSYQQKKLADLTPGILQLIAAPDASDGAVTIHQDVKLYRATVHDKGVQHRLAKDRRAYLQVVRGEIALNETHLRQGDGARIGKEEKISIGVEGRGPAEVLLFDLA